MHNLLFCVHTQCMSYVTSTFLLVSSSVRSKQLLCFVHGQGQKIKQKPTKNSIGFHKHSPPLTMLTCTTFDTYVIAIIDGLIDTKTDYSQSELNCFSGRL